MSAENPAVPLSAIVDGEELYDALTGGAGHAMSGVRVNRKKALGYSAIWRGVNLIAGAVGRLPFGVKRKLGKGTVPDSQHQAARVMRRPNDYMTPFTFRQVMQAHALLDGNGYAYIERDLGAKPLNLLPLHPGRTWPIRANGDLWYVTEIDGPVPGKRRNKRGMVKIAAADMLHIKGLGFDGLTGYPVVHVLRETIGTAIAARDYGSRYFARNGTPGVVLEVPPNMSEKAIKNLRESWAEMHEGVGNAHRTGILRDGVKLVPLTVTARDAQLLESREFDTREIANVLGVPAHKLGDTSKTAYNSLESENQSFLDDTLDNWLVAWEQEAGAKLLTEAEKEFESHECKFDRKALARTNVAAQADYNLKAITTGWLSPDEAREDGGLNPIPNGKGNVFYRPANVTPIATDASPADDAANTDPDAFQPDTNAVRAALRDLARDTVGRMVRRLATHTERAAKRPEELRALLGGGLIRDHAATVAAAFGPLVAASRAVGVKADDAAVGGAALVAGFCSNMLRGCVERPGDVSLVAGEYETEAARSIPEFLFPEVKA